MDEDRHENEITVMTFIFLVDLTADCRVHFRGDMDSLQCDETMLLLAETGKVL